MPLPLRYNWRNLMVRRVSSTLTFLGIATVVLVLAVLLSFAEAIRASLTSAGSPLNVIVLKPGATAESTSILRKEEIDRVMGAPNLARRADGELLVSPERSLQISIPRRGSQATLANVCVRGVDDVAFDVHGNVRVVQGRRYAVGAEEAIVGRAAAQRFRHTDVGDLVPLGRLTNRQFKVVGVFEAGGGALESEIWVRRAALEGVHAEHVCSSVLLRLADPARAAETIDYLNGPSVRLDAKLETEYYRDLSRQATQIAGLTTILVGIMAVGAAFAVANTMYASVDGRRREIAMLRTIGFPRRAILAAFLIESLLLSLAACAAGLALSLTVDGMGQDFLSNVTWTVLACELHVTPRVCLAALGVSIFVGVAGALLPALRASRIGVIEALRKA